MKKLLLLSLLILFSCSKKESNIPNIVGSYNITYVDEGPEQFGPNSEYSVCCSFVGGYTDNLFINKGTLQFYTDKNGQFQIQNPVIDLRLNFIWSYIGSETWKLTDENNQETLVTIDNFDKDLYILTGTMLDKEAIIYFRHISYDYFK